MIWSYREDGYVIELSTGDKFYMKEIDHQWQFYHIIKEAVEDGITKEELELVAVFPEAVSLKEACETAKRYLRSK